MAVGDFAYDNNGAVAAAAARIPPAAAAAAAAAFALRAAAAHAWAPPTDARAAGGAAGFPDAAAAGGRLHDLHRPLRLLPDAAPVLDRLTRPGGVARGPAQDTGRAHAVCVPERAGWGVGALGRGAVNSCVHAPRCTIRARKEVCCHTRLLVVQRTFFLETKWLKDEVKK